MLGKPQFEALSEFRFRLAQFLHFSESAARAEGVTPAQYLLLLHLHGFNGRSWGTFGELAERPQASHQATVALVQRCERNGLVATQTGRASGRERGWSYVLFAVVAVSLSKNTTRQNVTLTKIQ